MKNEYAVRVVYIIPQDVKPWGDMKQRVAEYLEDMQWFFADEMSRYGFEEKTFEFAKDGNGELVFHQLNGSRSDLFRTKPWNECKRIAEANDLRNNKDIVIYFYEYHPFSYNGKPVVSSRGAMRKNGGEAFLSSLYIKLALREWLARGDKYNGEIFDWIRSKPMAKNTLNWNGRGQIIGDVCGASYGIIAHELGHALGLHHDRENDRNRKGNLMGNGCRGMRGYFRPDLTDDFCVLTKKDAIHLNDSKFFSNRSLKNRSTAFGM